MSIRESDRKRSVCMNTKNLLLNIAVAALSVAAIQAAIAAQKSNAATAEEKFIKKAADANMTEIQLGKMAGENGQSQAVKDFGQRMVTDHTKIGDDLKPIAAKLNVEVPTEVTNPKHKQAIDEMAKLKGNEFDKKYSSAMVQDHETVIAMFEKAEGEVKDAELKKFIADTLPILKEHLAMAKKLPSGK